MKYLKLLLIALLVFNTPSPGMSESFAYSGFKASASEMWSQNEAMLLLLCFLGLSCACIFLFTLYQMKIQKSRKEIELEISVSKHRLSKLSEEHRKLTAEFEANSARYDELIAKLEFKKELLGDIKSIIESTTSEKPVDSEIKTKVQKIIRNIHLSLHVDQEWDHFRSYFDKTDDSFLSNLKKQFPSLSPNDCKLCVLYKMDKDHEQIAGIMEISIESARVMKHRLKKKLGVPMNKSLREFLLAYDKKTDRTEDMNSRLQLNS
jgi:hypothetical protein